MDSLQINVCQFSINIYSSQLKSKTVIISSGALLAAGVGFAAFSLPS